MITATRLIAPGEVFSGETIDLRLVTMEDCTDRYVAWLEDPQVNRYLETRWSPQTLESVKGFVSAISADPASYLFAIIEKSTGRHVGNIKVGPINARHAFADISYFVGERASWGKGLGTDAIRVATHLAFDRLGVHRLQAGLYAGNIGSAKALQKAGYRYEAKFAAQLRGPDGWEDHLWYVQFKSEVGK